MIGTALLCNIPNCNGLFWVDFTITELFPVAIHPQPTHFPAEVTLFRNYPNPFNSLTILEYELNQSSDIQIIIYNLNGQIIKTYPKESQSAGLHQRQFDAGNNASGVYLVHLLAGNMTLIRKVTLIK